MTSESKNKILQKRDLWLGLIIIVFATVFFMISKSGLKEAMFFPSIVFGGMMLIGVAVMLTAIRNKNAVQIKDINVYPIEVVMLVLLIVSINVISIIGFYTTILILSVILLAIFLKDLSIKAIIRTLIYSVVMTGAVYFIFTVLLRISTPKGFLI